MKAVTPVGGVGMMSGIGTGHRVDTPAQPHRRVLFCTLGYPPGPTGGAERQARLQAEGLARRGHLVTVICPATRLRSERTNGVTIHRLPCVPRRYWTTLTYLPFMAAYLLLRARRYDLVHVHLANLQVDAAALALRVPGVPLYVKLAAGGRRGEIGRLRGVARLTRYVGIRSARRVQALSDEIADEVLALGVPSTRVLRIPNGLDASVFRPADSAERGRLRQELGLPDGDVVLLFAGRLARYKGVLDLIDAWRSLSIDTPAQLVLVGEDAVDDPVPALPDAPGLVVRGWSGQIADYYRAADVFVLPSHVEGMSNALLEAMGCGLAVVATRVGAAPEMIDPGVTGVLVNPGDVAGLSAALARLISDPGLRVSLGRQAASATRDRYGIESVVTAIEAAYSGMLADPQGKAAAS